MRRPLIRDAMTLAFASMGLVCLLTFGLGVRAVRGAAPEGAGAGERGKIVYTHVMHQMCVGVENNGTEGHL